MKVKCINQGNFKNITLGNEYQLLEESVDLYIIINNSGVSARYSKDYFEVIPEPIPNIIEDVEEVGVKEDEIDIDFDEDGNIDCSINGNNVELDFYEVASNCGVKSYHGVNYLFENCDHNPVLFEKVITAIIEEIIYRNNSCMLIFSTNNTCPEIWTALDKVMDFSSQSVENPNSDLQVKLWIKYV